MKASEGVSDQERERAWARKRVMSSSETDLTECNPVEAKIQVKDLIASVNIDAPGLGASKDGQRR